MAGLLTIGQLARTTGITAKTIRYYEGVGVLPAPKRTASGYRQYDSPAVERLRFIRLARAVGLPLQRLKALTVALTDTGSRPPLRREIRAVVDEHLSSIEHQIAELEMLRQQLGRVSRRLRAPSRRRSRGPCRCLEA